MATEAKLAGGRRETICSAETADWWVLMGYSQEAAERAVEEEAAWV